MNGLIFTGSEEFIGLDRSAGSYRIATHLRNIGVQVEVVDYFFAWTYDELKELLRLRHKNISWIGISTTWVEFFSPKTRIVFEDFLRYIKKTYPQLKIIGGGQNPTLQLGFYKYVDYAIHGFGEVAITKLLQYLYSNGERPRMWPFRARRGLVPPGYFIDANANYQAWPNKDLSIDYQDNDFIQPNETLGIEMSRGCKFACAFCNFPVLGVKEDTTRNLDVLETEFKVNYDKFGVSRYQIADETLNDRDEKLAKIGSIVNKMDFDLDFNAFIRADILFSRPQQKELLADARVWGHFYGIETMNHESGKLIGKGMHPDKIKQGLLDTEQYFNNNLGLYRGTCSLIYGLPLETKETLKETEKWLTENWKKQSVVAKGYRISTEGNSFSKIDKDLEKYGYELIDVLNIKNEDDWTTRKGLGGEEIPVWQNSAMNYLEASEMADKFTSTVDFKVDSWVLFSLLPLGPKDDVLSVKNIDIDPESDKLFYGYMDKAYSIKREYVRKKLNYGT